MQYDRRPKKERPIKSKSTKPVSLWRQMTWGDWIFIWSVALVIAMENRIIDYLHNSKIYHQCEAKHQVALMTIDSSEVGHYVCFPIKNVP